MSQVRVLQPEPTKTGSHPTKVETLLLFFVIKYWIYIKSISFKFIFEYYNNRILDYYFNFTKIL